MTFIHSATFFIFRICASKLVNLIINRKWNVKKDIATISVAAIAKANVIVSIKHIFMDIAQLTVANW
jgi:hypothetical protein